MAQKLPNKEDFEPQVGSVFTVAAEGRDVELKLEEVTEYPKFASDVLGPDGKVIGTRIPFALSFSGPKDALLADSIFKVTHPELGEMDLFVKPYHEAAEAYLYECVFN